MQTWQGSRSFFRQVCFRYTHATTLALGCAAGGADQATLHAQTCKRDGFRSASPFRHSSALPQSDFPMEEYGDDEFDNDEDYEAAYETAKASGDADAAAKIQARIRGRAA